MAFAGREIPAGFFVPGSDGTELKRKRSYLVDFMYLNVEKLIHVREALLKEKSSGKIILHYACCKNFNWKCEPEWYVVRVICCRFCLQLRVQYIDGST